MNHDQTAAEAASLQEAWLKKAAARPDGNLIAGAIAAGLAAHENYLKELKAKVKTRAATPTPELEDVQLHRHPLAVALAPFLSPAANGREELMERLRSRISLENQYLEAAARANTQENRDRLQKQARDERTKADQQIERWFRDAAAPTPPRSTKPPKSGAKITQQYLEKTLGHLEKVYQEMPARDNGAAARLFRPTWRHPEHRRRRPRRAKQLPHLPAGITLKDGWPAPAITFDRETLEQLAGQDRPNTLDVFLADSTGKEALATLRQRREKVLMEQRKKAAAWDVRRETKNLAAAIEQNPHAEPEPQVLYATKTLQLAWETVGESYRQPDWLLAAADGEDGENARRELRRKALAEQDAWHTEMETNYMDLTMHQRVARRSEPHTRAPRFRLTPEELQEIWNQEEAGPMPTAWLIHTANLQDPPLVELLRQELHLDHIHQDLLEECLDSLNQDRPAKRRNAHREALQAEWQAHDADEAATARAQAANIPPPPPRDREKLPPLVLSDAALQTLTMELNPAKPKTEAAAPPSPRRTNRQNRQQPSMLQNHQIKPKGCTGNAKAALHLRKKARRTPRPREATPQT